MISPTPPAGEGDKQSCRDPRAAGASSDTQYPHGPASTSASQAWPPEPPVAMYPALAGPAGRPQPRDEVGPRPQSPAIERRRVAQLGPARVAMTLATSGPPGRSTSPTHLLPAAATA